MMGCLQCPPVHLGEFDIERPHGFNGFLDSYLLGNAIWIFSCNLGRESITDASCSMIQWCPEDISMCFAFNRTLGTLAENS
jgi:hypothetical protein